MDLSQQASGPLEVALASLDDQFFVLDGHFCYLYLNAAAAAAAAQPAARLLGRRIWDVRPDLIGTPFFTALQSAARRRRSTRFRAYDARRQAWFEWSLSPSADGVIGLACLDQNSLGAAAADPQQYLEILPALIWTSLPDGSLGYCNQRLQDYAQRSLDQLLGKQWLDLVHPEDVDRVCSTFAAALGADASYEVEYRLRRAADGAYRWFLVRGNPLRDEQGRIILWCGTAADIQERKRSEEALEESQTLLRHSQRSAQVGSFLVEIPDVADRSRDRVRWSDELFRIFGYQPGEAEPSMALALSCVQPDREEIVRVLDAARRQRQPFQMDWRIRRADGERTLHIWGEFELGEPLRLWGTCQDVTEERHAMNQVREADRRKNEFLAILAHELRNPLAPIRQSVVIARSDRASSGQRQLAFEIIDRQVTHMARLLEDLLETSRLCHGRLELRRQPTTLASALLAAVETARPQIDSRGHSLALEVPEEPIWLDADPVRLAQIFSNLLINAAKYTDPGGRIDVRATTLRHQVSVFVRDTGIGITPEQLPRLFDMFAPADPVLGRSQGGLGIGLALTHGLVLLHGGTIEVNSAGRGAGSEFVVTLPRSAAPEKQSMEKAVAADDQRARRIIVVEDNPDAAESLAMSLALAGHQVKMAHDGRQALAVSAVFHPDIALLDIGLPEINGYELARQIRAQPWGRHILLVAVTGWGQDEDRRSALAAGFDEHLTKPVDPERLMSLVNAPSRGGQMH